MEKQAQANKDWIARQEGRIPSKGAQAAQRASAGLGATDHDAELMEELFATRAALKPAPRSVASTKD
jgi:hypothetical protein